MAKSLSEFLAATRDAQLLTVLSDFTTGDAREPETDGICVKPASYAGLKKNSQDKPSPRYIIFDGKEVLIDSVQSQANRMEEALSNLLAENKKPLLPDIIIKSSATDAVLTSANRAPHRFVGAEFAACTTERNGKEKLYESAMGKAWLSASPQDGTQLFMAQILAIVFGAYPSQFANAGRYYKWPRLIEGKIRGYGDKITTRTGGIQKSDPLDLAVKAIGKVFVSKTDRSEFRLPSKPDDKPAPNEEKKNLTDIGFGCIPNAPLAGVRCERIVGTWVIHIAALRSRRFGDKTDKYQAVLLTLMLYAALVSSAGGYLRDGCNLLGVKRTVHLAKPFSAPALYDVSPEDALDLFNQALDDASLDWAKNGGPQTTVYASKYLDDLIAKSKAVVLTGDDDDATDDDNEGDK